jgi:hypothetical protein
MLSSNALEGQVDELVLYVFDESGMLVDKHSRQGEAIRNTLVIEVDRPTVAGIYRFVAWGKGNVIAGDDAKFEIPDLTVGVSGIEELNYYLKTDSGVSRHELNHFLVGMSESEINIFPGTELIKINLKKVTKKVRVLLLPYAENIDLDVNNYSFSIVDPVGNGHINYDYEVLEGEPIVYVPYYKSNVYSFPEEYSSTGKIDKVVAVEFCTSRLMEKHAVCLLVSTIGGTGEFVNINLSWLFSLTEMEGHRDWTLQEYLDRQDEYVITLFFDNDKWIDATIIVNGWVVNNINIDS